MKLEDLRKAIDGIDGVDIFELSCLHNPSYCANWGLGPLTFDELVDKIAEPSELLAYSFNWSETKKGRLFWGNVHLSMVMTEERSHILRNEVSLMDNNTNAESAIAPISFNVDLAPPGFFEIKIPEGYRLAEGVLPDIDSDIDRLSDWSCGCGMLVGHRCGKDKDRTYGIEHPRITREREHYKLINTIRSTPDVH